MSEKRKLQANDVHQFTLVGEPQFSPDGQEILFIKQVTCLEDNKNYSTLWVRKVKGDTPKPLTHGKKSDKWARWSSDGQRIAFVSKKGEHNEIWVLERQGGEPWKLQIDIAVNSAPVWSPDGQKIAFTGVAFSKPDTWQPYAGAPLDDEERAKAQVQQLLTGDKKAAEKYSDVKVITRLRHKMDGIGYYGDLRSQIFVVDVPIDPSDKPVCTQMTDGDFDHVSPAWNPDGKDLIFIATRREDADYLYAQDIWRADVETKIKTQVMKSTGLTTALSYAPNGQWIAFVGNDGAYEISTSPNLWVIPAKGDHPLPQKEAINLTAALDRPVGVIPASDMRYATGSPPYVWDADSRTIHFIDGDRGSSNLRTVDIENQRVTTLWSKRMSVISSFDVHEGQYSITIGSPCQVEDLYLYDGQTEEQLTNFNKCLYESLALGKTQRFTYKGNTDWDVDGWVVTPPDWDGKTPLPTALFIHGGPHGVYGSSFMFQPQLLASNGIAVVYTNPRGSQTYGQEFAYAVVKDWGGHDYHDIMKGVDYVVDQGIADPELLGVTGWSYGGYMTCWIITQTQRFKTAVAGACVSNRHSFYGTSDIGYYFGEKQCGGTPWEEPLKLLERSAIHHMGNVTTPVMLMHGESDLRCPIEQTEEVFTALRRQGKEAVMIRYPQEYHAINQPKRKEDRHNRVLAWFAYYLK